MREPARDSVSEMPKVTVVTVVYNRVSEIEQTMRSVLDQTYPSIEYVVIDGGSTDGTADIIRKYADRLYYWASEPDAGVYDAMNKGIQKATGDWINFLNCGDYYYDTDTVADLVTCVDDVDFLYGDVFSIDSDGSPLRRERAREVNRTAIKNGVPACHQAMFVRRSMCPRYDTRYTISADLDWVLQIFRQNRVRVRRFTERPVVYYRVGGLSSFRYEGSFQSIRIIRNHFGRFDAFLRLPLLARWLIAAWVKRAFGITTLKKLFLAPRRHRPGMR